MKLEMEKGPSVTTDRLAGLLTLQQRLLAAKALGEADYILVNDTLYVFPGRQVLLFRHRKLCAHSGGTDTDQPSPYLHWARRAVSALKLFDAKHSQAPRCLNVTDLAQVSSELATEWPEHWPRSGLWLPMHWQQKNDGGLLILRDKPWSEAEQRLLGHWVDGSVPVMQKMAKRARRPHRRALAGAVIGIMLGLSLLLPVRLSVLAQSEVVPEQASIIRAPLNGIIDQRLVQPNALVQAGDLLVTLDDAELTGRLEKARQALAVARAGFQRARQSAFRDPRASAELPILSARVDQAQEQVSFLESELNRVTIVAPRAGVAIIGNPDDWVGRPVQLGERLMEVADTRGAEIELWLPSADAIPLQPGAPVSLFLNVDPSRMRPASLTRVNYRAETSPTGELAYRGRANLQSGQTLPRVGWRGTAKIEGEEVALGYYLFRRPWTAVRSWVGW